MNKALIRDKVVTADQAIALIHDGDAVSCSGFVGIGTPEELIAALERRFVETRSPRDLTLILQRRPGMESRAASTGWRMKAWSGVPSEATGRWFRSWLNSPPTT